MLKVGVREVRFSIQLGGRMCGEDPTGNSSSRADRIVSAERIRSQAKLTHVSVQTVRRALPQTGRTPATALVQPNSKEFQQNNARVHAVRLQHATQTRSKKITCCAQVASKITEHTVKT